MSTPKKTSTKFVRATLNQLGVAKNTYQRYDEFPRVLFVCSAGILRSATAAHVFGASPYDWNTRTVGTSEQYALNLVNEGVLVWADRIVVFTDENLEVLETLVGKVLEQYRHKIEVWDVPDKFEYRDPRLIVLLKNIEKKNEAAQLERVVVLCNKLGEKED